MSLRFAGIVCVACWLFAGSAQAVEPVQEFLEGLRARRYFDTALSYLDQLENDPGLTPEQRALLPYERAQILLLSAQDLLNLDAQRRQLEAAEKSFETFVKANPTHPLAAQANSARGRILLEKARVNIWDSERASNAPNRTRLRQSATNDIQAARRIFEQARDQFKKEHDKFPTYIPEDDKTQRAARDIAEGQLMEAELDLVQCRYWEAQTHDAGSKARRDLLTQANSEFEKLHQQYRTRLGGLYARLWQGKCYEEQGDIAAAEGIYSELLGHEGNNDALLSLKDRALRFRLICLNHEQRKQYSMAAQEAENWLKTAKTRARTDVGLGIQWELSRAQEGLGSDRNVSEAIRKSQLNQALSRAREINRYPGELKAPSSAMIQRLMTALNRSAGDPKDFDTAYGAAGQLWEDVITANAAVADAKAANDLKTARESQATLQATSAEMARLYDLALRLAPAQPDQSLLNKARIRLAYGYLLQQRFLDSAVLAEFEMDKYAADNPDIAAEAGFIALTAYDHAYKQAAEGDREFELEQITRIASKLAERFPNSERVNDARNAVAKLHWQNGDLLQAAQWWEQIPAGTPQYADSQARAGKAYWRQYVSLANPREGDPASPEQLAQWKQAAVQHLEAGLQEAEKATAKSDRLSDEMVGAKLTLVSIRNLDGIYETSGKGPTGALNLLQEEPHPILKMVDVKEGEKRPQNPTAAQSRQIASSAWQQLLRTQIGLKNLDEARKAREKLESLAGSENDAALTQVFVEFGRELEQELTRLQAAGETKRLADVQSGFERFLNDLFERQEGQNFSSLLWIAETYSSLAEGSKDGSDQQRKMYEKAAVAYQSILERADRDPNFARPGQVTACKLRLVNSLRQQRKFDRAEPILTEILKGAPNSPEVQFAAAQLYQDWGVKGGPEAASKFGIALYGRQQPIPIWGWSHAAQSLQRVSAARKDERLEQLHYDARYNLADAEYQYGESLKSADPKEARVHYDRALAAILSFRRLSRNWPEAEYDRFNRLYRRVQGEISGQAAVTDLPRQLVGSTEPVAAATDSNQSTTPTAAQAAEPVAATPAIAPVEAPKSQGAFWLAILVALAGLGLVGYSIYHTTQGNAKRRKRTGSAISSPGRTSGTDIESLTLPTELLGPTGPPAAKKPRAAAPRKPLVPQPPPPKEKSS